MALLSFAHDFEVKNADEKTIYYEITSSSDLTVAVTYQGTSYSEYMDEYTGSVTIPDKVTYNGKTYSVTSIGILAFAYCSGLTSVTIGNSVTTISNDAFSGCSGLTSIVVEKGNTKYDSRNNCNAIIETASNTLISGCKTTVIPNSVTSIGNYAFKGCSGLTSVTIPNSVTSIGDNAFEGCSGLTSVTIGNSVTSIGDYAFYFCNGLTSVTIGNSVTSIGISAFAYCSGLTSVTIPNSVTSIGDYAFSGCSGLKEITSYIQEPFKTGDYCWDSVNKSIPLYVPAGTKEKYQGTDGWKEFTNIQEVDMTGIEAVTAEGVSNADITDIYDLNGRRRDALQPGVNIVKMSDGTTRKVIKR